MHYAACAGAHVAVDVRLVPMRSLDASKSGAITDADASPDAGDAVAAGLVGALVVLAVLGIVARLVLACVSYGTNDFRFYLMFARTIVADGMGAALRSYDEFNLTPAMSAYSVVVLLLSEVTGAGYALLFKLPLIAADAAAAVLLWRVWRRRGGNTRVAALAAALFAWSLDSILVTGYHCNTDPFYGFLSLLAVYLVVERERHFAAGLVLAAAINVKLIPVVLAPALLAAQRDRGGALRFLGALALGAVPFGVMLLVYGGLFYEQVVNYDSQLTNWGVSFFLLRGAETPALADLFAPLVRAYRAWGKYLMLGAIALAAVVGRRRGWDAYRSAAVAVALFLILAPGFGMQYTVAAVPLLFAVSLPFGALYSLAAGAYLLTLYVRFSRGTFPWESFFPGTDPVGPALVGLVAWGVLVAFVAWQLREPRPPQHDPVPGATAARA